MADDSMADKDEDVSVTIQKDDLIHTLTCKICNDFYKSPQIITSCYCTFCYGCLMERMRNGLKSCPSCKISFDLFATGQTLPDHHLQTVVDHIRPYFTPSTDIPAAIDSKTETTTITASTTASTTSTTSTN